VGEVKGRNRLNPGAILDAIYAGRLPDSESAARALGELRDPESTYARYTLIEILGCADYYESIPTIREYFLTSDDPFAVHAALIALFREWSEDPASSVYSQRIQSLASGLEWDVDGLVARAVRTLTSSRSEG
jgi:HEAT repeat protein